MPLRITSRKMRRTATAALLRSTRWDEERGAEGTRSGEHGRAEGPGEGTTRGGVDILRCGCVFESANSHSMTGAWFPPDSPISSLRL